MNEPTDEQIKEFWEWCGFKFVGNELIYEGLPDVKVYLEGKNLRYPNLDLNNLFKYAVPKLQGKFNWELSVFEDFPNAYHCDIWANQSPHRSINTQDKDPALALFWAIWEVIKGTNQS